MSRHHDFELLDSKDHRIILRIYEFGTSIYGYSNMKPKIAPEVYKVYYDWKILYQEKDLYNGHVIDTKTMFEMWDECSVLFDMDKYIKTILKDKKEHAEAYSLGYPASIWEFDKVKDAKETFYKYYKFTVWNRPFNQGYQFWLSKEKMIEFAEWLEDTNKKLIKYCARV